MRLCYLHTHFITSVLYVYLFVRLCVRPSVRLSVPVQLKRFGQGIYYNCKCNALYYNNIDKSMHLITNTITCIYQRNALYNNYICTVMQ